jgi:transcriptional regulator with XRE-family HTH domain
MKRNPPQRPATPASPQLGDCVRALRRRLNLTLTEVHERTGIAKSTLSKVENNLMSLTYDTIVQLAMGLGVDVAELFSSSPPPSDLGRRSFAETTAGMRITTANYDYHYLCADLARKRMVPMFTEIRVRTMEEFGPLIRHSGEEFTYVVSGVVEFHSEFYKPLRMRAGSSIYFDARMGHAYLSVGRAPAKTLCVCSAPEKELTDLADRSALPDR